MSTHVEAQVTEPGRLRKAVRRYWMIWLVVPMLLLDGCTAARTERPMCGPDAATAADPCVNERPRPALGTHQQAAPCFG